jgi:acetyltransferase-like isoleucine patch superfamily enzyme
VIREQGDENGLAPVKVAVFGGKGGGTLAVQTLRAIEQTHRSHRFVDYLNDRVEKGTALFGGAVAGRFDDWRQLDDDVGFVAPLHKAGAMEMNAHRIVGLEVPDARWTTLVGPLAITAEGARIGFGSIVSANGQIGPDSSVGAHCFVRAGAIVSHDVSVSNFVYLGQNNVILGYSTIETGAHIAPGSIVRDGTKVGRFALVTLGSVVTSDVPPYAIVRGNSAEIIGQISPLNYAID